MGRSGPVRIVLCCVVRTPPGLRCAWQGSGGAHAPGQNAGRVWGAMGDFRWGSSRWFESCVGSAVSRSWPLKKLFVLSSLDAPGAAARSAGIRRSLRSWPGRRAPVGRNRGISEGILTAGFKGACDQREAAPGMLGNCLCCLARTPLGLRRARSGSAGARAWPGRRAPMTGK